MYSDENDFVCDKCQNEIIFLNINKIIKSIKIKEVCENCKEIVSAKILGKKWYSKVFFQCGGDKKKLFSWCSEKCFNEKNK